MCATILVPFDNLLQLQETFCRALELADQLTADVILLRVNLPDSSLSYQANEEQLYRELKALQVQCASYATAGGSRQPGVRIETSQGPPERAIIRYAARHKVDLILSAQVSQVLDGGDRHFQSAGHLGAGHLSAGRLSPREVRAHV